MTDTNGYFFGNLLYKICESIEGKSYEEKAKKLYRKITDEHKPIKVIKNDYYDKIQMIDPLSFISYVLWKGIFNFKKPLFGLNVPNSFDGIVYLSLFDKINKGNYESSDKETEERVKNTVIQLWKFSEALNKENKPFEYINESMFNDLIAQKGIKVSNLTPIMYICRPKLYYPIDKTMHDFLLDNNYVKTNNSKLTIIDYDYYKKLISKFDPKGFKYNNYVNINNYIKQLYNKTPYKLYQEALKLSYMNFRFKDFLNNYYYIKPNIKIQSKKSIPAYCREERQFALFLYNKLLSIAKKNDKEENYKLLNKCGLSNIDQIICVYYEVPFLRDFLDKEKKRIDNEKVNKIGIDKNGNYNLDYLKETFNYKLFHYVLEKFRFHPNVKKKLDLSYLFNFIEINDTISLNNKDKIRINSRLFPLEKQYHSNLFEYYDLEYKIDPCINYGTSSKSESVKKLPYFIRILMSAMMCSKPDIGIIYKKGDKYHLKFIECKYLSREGYTKLIDIKVDNNKKHNLSDLLNDHSFILPQTVIQYFIADFICKCILKDEDNFVADKPTIVRFGKCEEDDSNDYDNNQFYFYRPDWYSSNNKVKIEKSINIINIIPDYLKNINFLKL